MEIAYAIVVNIHFSCTSLTDDQFRIEITTADSSNEISVRHKAQVLNSILCTSDDITNICWFDQENNTYGETALQ